ncbi:MAG: Fur family transcriptional regulator [Candidatus Eiseniibacteriota bacterium]
MARAAARPADSHDHQHCIEEALDAASNLCQARGARFTAIRRRVLELVWSSHQPVKAYDLLEQLNREDRGAKPPTVYRALDFLIGQGLVHRLESQNAFIGCPHPGQDHDYQFLICDGCGTVAEIAAPAVRAALAEHAAAIGFTVKRQTIEVYGTCRACTRGRAAAG